MSARKFGTSRNWAAATAFVSWHKKQTSMDATLREFIAEGTGVRKSGEVYAEETEKTQAMMIRHERLALGITEARTHRNRETPLQ